MSEDRGPKNEYKPNRFDKRMKVFDRTVTRKFGENWGCVIQLLLFGIPAALLLWLSAYVENNVEGPQFSERTSWIIIATLVVGAWISEKIHDKYYANDDAEEQRAKFESFWSEKDWWQLLNRIAIVVVLIAGIGQIVTWII